MKHLILAAAMATSAHHAPTVSINDFRYQPATLTITAGETVRFVNRDQEAHTITASDNSFDSAGVDTNGAWTHRFTRPGRYTYFCELHPYMKGTIIVLADPQGSRK